MSIARKIFQDPISTAFCRRQNSFIADPEIFFKYCKHREETTPVQLRTTGTVTTSMLYI